jgi:hypothetical protein
MGSGPNVSFATLRFFQLVYTSTLQGCLLDQSEDGTEASRLAKNTGKNKASEASFFSKKVLNLITIKSGVLEIVVES